MLCTSGFVDNVIFLYNGSDGGVTLPQQPLCNLVHRLTLLLVLLLVTSCCIDDGELLDNTSRSCKECRERSLRSTISSLCGAEFRP